MPEVLDERDIIGDVALYKQIENFQRPKSYAINFETYLPRAINWIVPPIEKMIAPKPKINKSKCIGCGKCKAICPQQVITIKKKKAKIDLTNCIKCFCCHEVCPDKAIDIKKNLFFNL